MFFRSIALRCRAGEVFGHAKALAEARQSASSRRATIFRALKVAARRSSPPTLGGAGASANVAYVSGTTRSSSAVETLETAVASVMSSTSTHSHLRQPSPEGCGVNWCRGELFDHRALRCRIFDPSIPALTRLFIDRSVEYCFLCRETLTNIVDHTTGWDHPTRLIALHFCLAWLRCWSAAEVLQDAAAFLPPAAIVSLVPSLASSPWLVPHVSDHVQRGSLRSALKVVASLRSPAPSCCFTVHGPAPSLTDPGAVQRREELAAMLVSLTEWGVLRYCFTEHRDGAANNGERSFRATFARLSNRTVPPLAPQGVSRFQQLCWGRGTLELLFDALHIGDRIQVGMLGLSAPSSTKNEKGEVMRQLFFELHCATDLYAKGFERTGTVDSSSGDVQVERSSPPPEVLESLAESALERCAFEVMSIRSSIMMDDASGGMWGLLGFPTMQDIALGEEHLL